MKYLDAKSVLTNERVLIWFVYDYEIHGFTLVTNLTRGGLNG